MQQRPLLASQFHQGTQRLENLMELEQIQS
jgi:hypothetical protein